MRRGFPTAARLYWIAAYYWHYRCEQKRRAALRMAYRCTIPTDPVASTSPKQRRAGPIMHHRGLAPLRRWQIRQPDGTVAPANRSLASLDDQKRDTTTKLRPQYRLAQTYYA